MIRRANEVSSTWIVTVVLGIPPDFEIHVREDVLEEIDGPMLQHGLKEMHGGKLILPKRPESRPDRELLHARYHWFRDA